jgi:hypothetical protein
MMVGGCACSGNMTVMDGGVRIDARPSDSFTMLPDQGVDAFDPCETVRCTGFTRCIGGTCMPYPACAGDGTCPEMEVCSARYCVPATADIDGDGSPASEDCDETNPDRSPLEEEICNGIDDDCDMMTDEGDPSAICDYYPGGGICMMGNCGCPPGTFDLDRTVSGCECNAMPAMDAGRSCPMSIELGEVSDVGQALTIGGNVLPDDREVWYHFVGRDTPDTACDNFHVRVLMLDNPGDAFEFTVFRDTCDMVGCSDTGFTDYRWATDFRADIGGTLTGECACWTGAPVDNVSPCSDNTEDFYVRVRRRAGSTISCAAYTIEVSNGMYDTP